MDAETYNARMAQIFADIDRALAQQEWVEQLTRQRARRHMPQITGRLAPVIPLRPRNTDDTDPGHQ